MVYVLSLLTYLIVTEAIGIEREHSPFPCFPEGCLVALRPYQSPVHRQRQTANNAAQQPSMRAGAGAMLLSRGSSTQPNRVLTNPHQKCIIDLK